MPSSVRDAIQDEFLCQIGSGSLAGSDQEVPEKQSETSIRRWIIGIRDGSRAEVATNGRVVRLQPPIVSPADKWEGDCVENARLRRPPTLVEVARVLVQKRWQDSATYHDVGEAVGIGSAVTLTESFPSLRVVGVVSGLLGARGYAYSNKRYRIEGDLGGESEL